jgi:hypothetical protein
MPNLCPKCGRQRPDRLPGAGRPSEYCSKTCRRASGYEIARILKLIENLETSLSRGRTSAMAMLFESEIKREYAELALQREKLHRVLADSDDENGPSEENLLPTSRRDE